MGRERLLREPSTDQSDDRHVPSATPRSPAARLVELQASAGNAAVARLVGAPRVGRARQLVSAPVNADSSAVAGGDMWIGQIDTAWSAALRSSPAKDPDHPHANTIADLPRDTFVRVIGKSGGWLHVEVELTGSTLKGYVSHELVRHVRPSSFEFEPLVITGRVMTVSNAFLILKRAETRLAADPKYAPSEEERNELELAIQTLELNGRYAVDRTTYRVSFDRSAAGPKIKIDTIEDFILFVETVEREYPTATSHDVASEIRQAWFRDENWDVLVGSWGITRGSNLEDIETEPNPIARMFDMTDLAPKRPMRNKQISTRLGPVDISHVLAGIDARLSGSPASLPFGKDELKYKTLKAANKGDPRDFATWSGDIGQAYAEYLVARYVKGESAATLATFVNDQSPADQLLADIHGYIAVHVWNTPGSRAGLGDPDVTVSNILRALYLVDKAGTPAAASYQSYMAKVSGKSEADLRAHVAERSLGFARVWFVKKAVDYRGKWKSEGWTEESGLKYAMAEFDRQHAENERVAATEDKLDGLVDSFMKLLEDDVK